MENWELVAWGASICSLLMGMAWFWLFWTITKSNRERDFQIRADNLFQAEAYQRSERAHQLYGMPRLFPKPEGRV